MELTGKNITGNILPQDSGSIFYGVNHATTGSRTTSVGTLSIHRFTRPVCYQNFTQNLLPVELKDNNLLNIWRLINGVIKND